MKNSEVKNTSQYSTMANVILGLVLLIFFIVILVVFTWRVDTYRRIAVEEKRPVVEWVQRSNFKSSKANDFSIGLAFSSQKSEAIRSSRWSFDYWPIELLVRRVKVDAGGQLILNDDLSGILNSIASTLPPELDRENLSRLRDLIEINITGVPGEEFAALAVNFYDYHGDFQKWLADNRSIESNDANNNSDDLEVQFRQSLKMMYASIGKDKAEAIFGKQHALKEYLFQRRRINENTALSADEKNNSLIALEAKFRESQK